MDSSDSHDDMVYCRTCYGYHGQVSGGVEHPTRYSIRHNESINHTTQTLLDTNTQESK